MAVPVVDIVPLTRLLHKPELAVFAFVHWGQHLLAPRRVLSLVLYQNVIHLNVHHGMWIPGSL
jgi:hypothetical protein